METLSPDVQLLNLLLHTSDRVVRGELYETKLVKLTPPERERFGASVEQATASHLAPDTPPPANPPPPTPPPLTPPLR